METKEMNIVKAREEYICHQCNCVSHEAAGLASELFRYFPYCDIYGCRWEPDKPGTIVVSTDTREVTNPKVIALLAQYYPGKPRENSEVGDSPEHRKKYFIDCLKEIKKLNPHSLAFPNGIGCGLAKGDPEWYSSVLEKFESSTKIPITLYRKE